MKTAFAEFPEACELTLELPPPHEKVIIIGGGYRTVGYVDEQGDWRQHFDGVKLEDVTDWYYLK